MKKAKLLNSLAIGLGIAAILIFTFNFIFLSRITPKMVAFEALTDLESNLLTVVGVGLLLILGFCLLSIFQIVRYLRYAEEIKIFAIILLVLGILTMLFIFADIALLTDVVHQYEESLAQPEWLLLYPIIGVQAVIVLLLLILHLSKFFINDQPMTIVKDSNIYLIVQVVGVVSGAMGLAASSLGFFFPNSWDRFIHTISSMVILSSPYALAVVYWLMIKVREKDKHLYDEKQRLDIGRSAFLTILITTVGMILLFALNFNNLDGILSMIWLPLLFFGEVFVFSLGNLIYNSRP